MARQGARANREAALRFKGLVHGTQYLKAVGRNADGQGAFVIPATK